MLPMIVLLIRGGSFMRTILMTSFLLLALGVIGLRAEIIEINLPQLHGPYPQNCPKYPADCIESRTTSFELKRIPTVIHAAWFRISGTATLGECECEWGGPYLWPMDFYASMMDSSTGGYWLASSPLPQEPGKFEFTWKFDPAPISTTTWQFLMDGRAEITLNGFPAFLLELCHPTTDPPRGVIDKAVLVIDGDFPVPTGSETWGQIKALYYEH